MIHFTTKFVIILFACILIAGGIVIYLIYTAGSTVTVATPQSLYPIHYGLPEPPPDLTVPPATWNTNNILTRNGRSDLQWASDIYDTMIGNPIGTTGANPCWVDSAWLRGLAVITQADANNLCNRPCLYYEPRQLMLPNGLCDCYPDFTIPLPLQAPLQYYPTGPNPIPPIPPQAINY
jgi:hypothetical protein